MTSDGPRERWWSRAEIVWTIGLVLLLAWAAVIAFIGSRAADDDFRIPPVVLEYEEALAAQAGESVRRSLNQGVDDLVQFARNAEGFGASDAVLEDELGVLADVHGRYAAVYILDADGGLLTAVGDPPVPDAVAAPVEEPGMRDAYRVDDRAAVLVQFSPLGDGSLVGHYDPAFLRFPLSIVEPGEAWVVDREGRIITGLEAAPMLAALPRPELREAAQRAARGERGAVSLGEGFGSSQVVAFAPIGGAGPAGELGWSVVSSRRAASMPSDVGAYRRLGVLAGAVLALITVVVFAWLRVARPRRGGAR